MQVELALGLQEKLAEAEAAQGLLDCLDHQLIGLVMAGPVLHQAFQEQ